MDDSKLRSVIAEANRNEDLGNYEQAEAGYLKAVELAGDNRLLVGQLYINLGKNAEAGHWDDEAVTYFRKAIKSLEGIKGDGLIQCAYAHWNVARTLLRLGDPDAVQHANRAKELFDRHPFASPVDVADALVVHVLASAQTGQTVSAAQFRQTWDAIRSVPHDELDPAWAEFAVNYLLITSQLQTSELKDGEAELRAWVPTAVADEILRVVKGLQRRRR